MAASAASGPGLRRERSGRIVAGVCSGIGVRYGVDPLLIRITFVVAATAGGLGVAIYLLAWVVIPAGTAAAGGRRLRTGRGAVEVALGAAFLLLGVLLAFREAGLWFSDALVWPLVLAAGGGALLWRQSVGPPAELPAEPAASPAEPESPGRAARRRAAVASRTSVGVALVIAAGLVFLQATGALNAARDVVLAVLVAAVVLGVIFAPWIVRLARSLTAERSERIRSQERAEVAAHLHDSVLQTLALVQKRAEDPREVAALARRQERELRAWLTGASGRDGAMTGLAAALDAAAEEVEQAHGVTIDVVAVGDRDLDEETVALVAAAREAMTNAAKFAGGSPVAVYAEATPERIEVFVRDRGPGFDPAAVPEDRHGLRESVVGRMERHGGRATVRSSGDGTEVELSLGA